MTGWLDGWSVVFDLDGTLVDTAPDLLNALNHVLDHAGLETVDLQTVAGMIGHGAKAMIRKGMSHQGLTPSEPDLDTPHSPMPIGPTNKVILKHHST